MSLGNRLSGFLNRKLNSRAQPTPPPPPPVPHYSKPSASSVYSPTLPSPSSATQLPPQPSIYWAPNFNPDEPISNHFIHKTGHNGWGNNELQNYTTHTSNSFFTADNRLVIRAIALSSAGSSQDKFTSARLVTKQTLERDRGFLFARLTAPRASGIWPAFWLLPNEPFTWPGDGEIDIFENWNGEIINHSCLHWGQHNGEDWDKHRVVETDIQQSTSRWGVTVGLAWEQTRDGSTGWLVWYIDNRPVMRAVCPPGMRRMKDFTVVINVAMGGVVCGGNVPRDGSYDLVVHELKMFESPFGGWNQFLNDWAAAPEGHTN